MRRPWRLDEDGQVHQVEVERPAFSAGDWPAVEEWLGVPLPSDYKELIGAGSAMMFDDELVIASPFSESSHLGRQIAYGSWSLAYLRQQYPEEFDVRLFPEPGGLLCWGSDGGGGVYYWDTTLSDANRWTVVVSGRSVDDGGLGERHACGLAGYLAGLAEGTFRPRRSEVGRGRIHGFAAFRPEKPTGRELESSGVLLPLPVDDPGITAPTASATPSLEGDQRSR